MRMVTMLAFILLISASAASQWTISTSTAVGPPSGPTASLTANPTSIAPSGSTTLTWTTTGAASATLDSSSIALNGSQVVSPSATTTYTLVATGVGGTKTVQLTVPVIVPGTYPWSGIIDPSRATDWSTAGVRGGIPTNWSQCGSTIQPSGIAYWKPRYTYVVGDKIADNRGYVFRVTSAGVSMSEQPNWSTTVNGTTTDGTTLVWTMSSGIDPAAMLDWYGNFVYWAGAKIQDPNGNTQTVTTPSQAMNTGTSSYGRRPTWTGATAVGNSVTDGGVTWVLDDLGGASGAGDTARINTALANCANQGGRVVQLAAGTFYLTNGINASRNYVVLRGAGADQTKLVFNQLSSVCGDSFVCASGSTGGTGSYPSGGAGQWIGGYTKGSDTIITSGWVGNQPSSGAIGSPLFLDQRPDYIPICSVDSSSNQPNGTGVCLGQYGFSMSGHTVTVRTTIPHGFSVGQCVGLLAPYNTLYGSTDTNSDYCGNVISIGWFQITSVPSPTSFTYELPSQTGLQPSGAGQATVDTGGMYVSSIKGAVTAEGGSGGRLCQGTGGAPNPACQPDDRSYMEQMESHVISDVIAGGTGSCPAGDTCYVLAEPLVWPSWQQARYPGVWWVGTGQYVNHIGLEDFTADFSDDTYNPSSSGSVSCFRFSFVVDGWIKGVRFIKTNRNAVWVRYSQHASVIDNYIASAKGVQSTAYGFELQTFAGYNLIANNICEQGPNCVMSNYSAGNVIAYNYTVDAPFYTFSMRPKINLNHESANYNLYEGNNSPGNDSDNIHGSSNAETVFRSRIIGEDYPRKQGPATSLRAFQRGYNYVGNVLGNLAGNAGSQGTINWNNIWDFGLNVSPKVNGWDVLVNSTSLRWGNFDSITQTANWCGNSSAAECMGVISALKQGTGSNPTGAAGQICWVSFDQNTSGNGARGVIQLTAQNTVPDGAPIFIVVPGTGYTTPPQTVRITAQAGEPGNLANCGGNFTFNVQSSVGPISEIPGAFSYFAANPVPVDTTLPASFYLPAQPSFWQMRAPLSTSPWPAIGPDVNASGPLDTTCTPDYPNVLSGPGSPTACDGIGHHAYQIPAQICYNSMQDDPAYPRPSWGPITGATYNTLSGQGLGVDLTVNNLSNVRFRVANSTIYFPDTVDIQGVNPLGYNGRYMTRDGTRSSLRYGLVIGATDPGPFVSGVGSSVRPVGPKIFNEHNCYVNE